MVNKRVDFVLSRMGIYWVLSRGMAYKVNGGGAEV